MRLLNKVALLISLAALFIFGCKEEESAPSECGQVEITIDGVPQKSSGSKGILLERPNYARFNLHIVTGSDTLILYTSVNNWQLLGPSPSRALVGVYGTNFKNVECIGSESFENCVVQLGVANFSSGNKKFLIGSIDSTFNHQISIYKVDETKKQVSGTFNVRVHEIGASASNETRTLKGTFTNLCYYSVKQQ